MARTSLPPGFRFHPTDVELVMYYLKRKLMGKKLSFEAISELNIYKFCPWDLPDKSCMRSKDLEWFFFCPREKKYASGARTNRATESGYWKTTGKDRPVIYKERTVGLIKTLVFHCGHAPRGERTDWVMHEYRIVDTDLADAGVPQDAYVLCKVFQKSGPGPKNGAQYGAPFIEEEWDDDTVIVAESSAVDGMTSAATVPSNNPNSSAQKSVMVPCTCSCSLTECGPSTAGPVANETLTDLPGDDDIVSLLAMFTEETSVPTGNDNNEEHNNLNPNRVIEAVPCYDGNDIYSGLGDLGNCVDLTEGGFNMSSILKAGYAPNPMFQCADTSFLELSDLETPLEFPAEAQLEQFTPCTFPAPCNSGEVYGNLVYGGNSLGTAQRLSPLNQPTALLEGSFWQGNNINMLQQENGIVGFASQGYSPASNHLDLASTRQPEGSSNVAAQGQIRGEQQRIPYSGRLQQLLESIPTHPASAVEQQFAPVSSRAAEISSDDESLSIHGCSGSSYFDVKAEVTPGGGDGGWFTKDALSWGSSRCRRLLCLATRSKTNVSVADLLAGAKAKRSVKKDSKPPTPQSVASSSEANASKKKDESKKRKLVEAEATDGSDVLDVEKTREKFGAVMKDFVDKVSEIVSPIMDQVNVLKIKATRCSYEAEESKKEAKTNAGEVARLKKEAKVHAGEVEKLKKDIVNLRKELADVCAEKAKENEVHVKELEAAKEDFKFNATKAVLEARIQLMEEFKNGRAPNWDLEEERRILEDFIGEPVDGEEVNSPVLEELVDDANKVLSTIVGTHVEENNQEKETNATPAAAGQDV